MTKKLVRKYSSIESKDLALDETLFHSANGYIGVRGAFEEGYEHTERTIRGSYINGVYEIVDMPQAENLWGLATKKQTILNVAEVLSVKLYADGVLVTPREGYERTLDLDRGMSERRFTNSGVTVETERLCSFAHPNIFMMHWTVKNEGKKALKLVTEHHANVKNFADASDPRVAAESIDYLDHEKAEWNGSNSVVTVRTKRSRIAVTTTCRDTVTGVEPTVTVENGVVTRTFNIGNGESFDFIRIVSFADSVREKDTETASRKYLDEALAVGIETIKKEQEGYLAEFWEDVGFDLVGDDALLEAVRFNLFSLLQSVGKDGISHLAAKGLSGEGYEGHYFWDTEMYVQPIFTLTHPEISRKLLEYRYSIIDKARENAELLGHSKGILYPWRTINGVECSGFFPAGSAQYHINGAIAHALIEYYEVTGDRDFMEKMGLEMLYGISELWLDTGVFTSRGFEIHEVTGPDEYSCCVNNNFYTNCSAKYDFEKTVELIKEFGYEKADKDELALFERAAKEMFLPYDSKLDINAQDDDFLYKKKLDPKKIPSDKRPMLMYYHPLYIYRHQVCKQADVTLAHMLYPFYSKKSTMENSLRYYEKITTHDSTLSQCIFGITASMLGLKDMALDYFSTSAEIDLTNAHGNTKDGIHTANMGGSYLSIIKGFAGLRTDGGRIALSPALPEKWTSLSFSFLWRGDKVSVKVEKGIVTVSSEKKITVEVYGKEHEVVGSTSIAL